MMAVSEAFSEDLELSQAKAARRINELVSLRLTDTHHDLPFTTPSIQSDFLHTLTHLQPLSTPSLISRIIIVFVKSFAFRMFHTALTTPCFPTPPFLCLFLPVPPRLVSSDAQAGVGSRPLINGHIDDIIPLAPLPSKLALAPGPEPVPPNSLVNTGNHIDIR